MKEVRVAEAVSQLPKVEQPRATSERVVTAEQLNAQKQNKRRAAEKARLSDDSKRQRTSEATAVTKLQLKQSRSAEAADPARLLDTVAEFWERKKARLAANASSASAG